MGQQFSVETLTSTDTDDGCKYWSSFEPYPNDVGENKLAYLGILNGEGPRKGEKCIVKAFRNGFGTYNNWNFEVFKAQKANEMAMLFNKEMNRIKLPGKIRFNVPMLVEIDEVSSFMCVSMLLGKTRKKMREFEIVAIETFLEGQFKDFYSNSVQQSDIVIPKAFSHYSWCKSRGQYLICGLKGVRNDCNYQFTVPIMHSLEGKFGKLDQGKYGIQQFFAKHRCNHLCKSLPKPGKAVFKDSPFKKEHAEIDNPSINLDENENPPTKTDENENDSPFKTDENENKIEQLCKLNDGNTYMLRNYSVRVPNEQTRLLQHNCACAFFRIPCPHRGNSSFILRRTPSAPDESCIDGDFV